MRGLYHKLIVTLFWAACTSAKSGKKSSPLNGRCYGELGCFATGGPFHDPVYRPFNVYPQEREKIDTKFAFYTHVNPKREDVLKWSATPKEVAQTHFNATRWTKVLVHGWVDTIFFGQWMKELKEAFLVVGDYNVIIVDWRGGTGLPYMQATANTRLVGAEIALLVNKLEKAFGAKQETFHIVGHGLGAHVAGYAGERLPRLGRITGLDPADPYFRNMPREVRLDPTDARFVDVIHTDGGSIFDLVNFQGLGMSQPSGHVDFYPNGGRDMPGCGSTTVISELITKGIRDASRSIVCNHERAVSYFRGTITESRCTSIAFACTSFEDFRKGLCADCGHDGRLCARMGFHADEWTPRGNTSKEMYLLTSEMPPYCAYPFLVNIRLLGTDQHFATGYFALILHGTKGKAAIEINKGPLRLYGGVKNNFVVKANSDVGDVLRASFRFTSSEFFFFFRRKNMMLSRVDVMPMNEPLKTEERKNRTKSFCLYSQGGIPSGTQVQLSPCKHGTAP